MTGRDLDLVVMGDVNPDVVVRDAEPVFGQHEEIVSSIELTIGGSASIMATAAARLGLRVALIGVVGDDPLGRFMLAELAARDVDVDACRVNRRMPTGATVILTRGADRAILTARGAIADLVADDIPVELLRRARHLHVASYFLLEGLRSALGEVVGRANAAGATVSIDPNWDPTQVWDHGLRGLLARVDVFLPNEAEALGVSGQATIEAAADDLVNRHGCRLVVIKRGSGGALLCGVEAGRVAAAAYPVDVVDAVGAGDAFDAAFLAAWLDRRPVDVALRFAAAAGALSTRSMGGTGSQATVAQVEAALAGWQP